MSLKENFFSDLKDALKNKEELRLSVLRMLSSAVHNREIEKRSRSGDSELTEEELVAVLRSEAKKRKEAIVEFTKGNRLDLVGKESAELKILEEYLPAELSAENLEGIVKEVLAGLGQVTSKDFGRVMAEVMKKIKGQASGDRVSQTVRKFLENG